MRSYRYVEGVKTILGFYVEENDCDLHSEYIAEIYANPTQGDDMYNFRVFHQGKKIGDGSCCKTIEQAKDKVFHVTKNHIEELEDSIGIKERLASLLKWSDDATHSYCKLDKPYLVELKLYKKEDNSWLLMIFNIVENRSILEHIDTAEDRSAAKTAVLEFLHKREILNNCFE